MLFQGSCRMVLPVRRPTDKVLTEKIVLWRFWLPFGKWEAVFWSFARYREWIEKWGWPNGWSNGRERRIVCAAFVCAACLHHGKSQTQPAMVDVLFGTRSKRTLSHFLFIFFCCIFCIFCHTILLIKNVTFHCAVDKLIKIIFKIQNKLHHITTHIPFVWVDLFDVLPTKRCISSPKPCMLNHQREKRLNFSPLAVVIPFS